MMLSNLFFARAQMGLSLAFHIIFAVIGVALPLMMVIAEYLYIRTGDDVYLTLAKRWAKGAAILFAVGAVSGTVLSFELGLLWPEFMSWSGSIIGMPFSLEGFAFFTEAIFLGIYLYGWNKVEKYLHLTAGVLVAVSGLMSAIFVVFANAWMNTPAGFRLVDGKPVDIDPIAAMFNPSSLPEALHMVLAAYASVGFAVAGVHAFMMLKERDRQNAFHRFAIGIALSVGGICGVLGPVSGDWLAKAVARNQPVKLAAMEGQFETVKGAPLRIGGLPIPQERTTKYAIEVPCLLSVLAYDDPNAEVKGLNEWSRDLWPNVPLVHISFQIMVACGTFMALVAVWGAAAYLRLKRLPDSDLFLRALVITSPLGFIALEAGWMVTELGRQPWVIHGILRTREAVTPMPGLVFPFVIFAIVYLFLAIVVVWLLIRQILHSPKIAAESRAAPEDDHVH